ncbi:MAG: hypothetical protein U0869_05685 [Chloroflexota bacterium]
MASRSLAPRLGRTLGIAAFALALSAPATMAAGEPGSGGGGGGGGTVTPPPTAAACATVENLTVKGVKGPGLTAEVDAGFSIASCSTTTESVTYDIVLTGTFDRVIHWQIADWPARVLAPDKNLAQKWAMGGVPYRSAFHVDITVKDAATGAVLDTATGFASTPVAKP